MWNKTITDGLTYYTLKSSKYEYYRQSFDDSELLSKDEDLSLYGSYLRKEVPVSDNLSELPSGVYKFYRSNNTHLAEVKMEPSEYILDLEVIKNVKQIYKNFIDSKKIYEKLKERYKRAVLLYGPPGTGKTTAINQIVKDPIFNDVIVIYCEDILPLSYRNKLNLDPRLKIIIFEEIITTIKNDNLQRLLDFLDGSASITNMFVIATTNYPEKLPSNIVDRPSRIDKLEKIGYLTNDDKKKYFKHLTGKELKDSESKMLGNTTIAQLKEICLLCLCRNTSLEEALEQTREHQEIANSGFKIISDQDIEDDIY